MNAAVVADAGRCTAAETASAVNRAYLAAKIRGEWIDANIPLAEALHELERRGLAVARMPRSDRIDCLVCDDGERAKLHDDGYYCFSCDRYWTPSRLYAELTGQPMGKAARELIAALRPGARVRPGGKAPRVPTEDEIRRERRNGLRGELWRWLSETYPEWNPPLQVAPGWVIERPVWIPWEYLTDEPHFGRRGALCEDEHAHRYHVERVCGLLGLVHTDEDGSRWLEAAKTVMTRYIERRAK